MMRSSPAFMTMLPVIAAGMLAMALSACSSTSSLKKGEKLYTGADLTINAMGEIPDEGELKSQLERLITPDPNSKFLGLFRLKLWMYNAGIFRESFGEPPVLLQSVQPDRISDRMKLLLENKGYFFANVRYKVNEGPEKASIEYKADVSRPYVIDSVKVADGDTPLLDSIRRVMPETLLKEKVPYDLGLLRAERVRIDSALKDRGFFYFSPDFLIFRADSTAGNKTVDLVIDVKRRIPEEGGQVYTMGDIYVYSGYSLTRDTVKVPSGDTVDVDGFHYIDLDKKFDPPSIVRSVFFRKGLPYRREDHDITLNRLMNLGVFKFVNVRFEDTDSAGVPRLDAHIYLTPQLMKTIRFELQGVSKSNDFAGPVFNASYQNKNMFRGAELFKFNLETGYETSISSRQSGSSYQISGKAELQIPEFIVPFFKIENVSSRFVPKTHISIGGSLLNRLQYYQMITGDMTFGYTWKETLSKEHTLNPVAITFAHLTRRTDRFNLLLGQNPLLRKSFEEQFIVGPNYSFTYNDQLDESKKNHFYFKGSADFSGNIVSAVQSLLTGQKGTSDRPHKILGTVYSQYSKFDVDVRHYYHATGQTTVLASRLIAGVGFAYGNSNTLPYVKQFYIAGSNSIRAFQARTLGPGSYRIPDSLISQAFNDQAGDIKLEGNLDFRFPIYSIVHGAVFLDAGNIWLLHEDPGRPGSRFSTSKFLDEIAVGTGFGLRFDLSFFVIRFDLAWPLRDPWLPSGQRWIYDRVKFWDSDWRKNNLVLNIAIGYPF